MFWSTWWGLLEEKIHYPISLNITARANSVYVTFKDECEGSRWNIFNHWEKKWINKKENTGLKKLEYNFRWCTPDDGLISRKYIFGFLLTCIFFFVKRNLVASFFLSVIKYVSPWTFNINFKSYIYWVSSFFLWVSKSDYAIIRSYMKNPWDGIVGRNICIFSQLLCFILCFSDSMYR
jgi:hypothetical protein